MGTHHRRSVNNPFANPGHRTVGYSDHRYGNPHHHNQHHRGRKGCLRSPLTCFMIIIGCISLFILQSLLYDINPDKEKPFEKIPDIGASEINGESEGAIADRGNEKDLKSFDLDGESEPQSVENSERDAGKNDDLILQENTLEGNKGFDASNKEDRFTNKIEDTSPLFGSFATNDKDFMKNLNEAQSDGGVQTVNHTEVIGTEKENEYIKEDDVGVMKNDNSISQEDISNHDENFGMEKKNLTTTTSDNVTIDDSSTSVLNVSESPTPFPSNRNQMISTELLSANTNTTSNGTISASMEKKSDYLGEDDVGVVTKNDSPILQEDISNHDENFEMHTKNLTTTISDNVTIDDSSTSVLNVSESPTPLPSNHNQMISKKLLSANTNTTSNGSISGNSTIQYVTTPVVTSNVTIFESKHLPEEGLEDRTNSLLNPIVAEIKETTTELLFTNGIEKDSNFSSNEKSKKNEGEPKASPNTTVAEIIITKANSEVAGEAARISQLNISNIATIVDNITPSPNFINVTTTNVTNTNASHTNILGTSVPDTESVASVSNNTESVKSKNSTINPKLESIANNTTSAINESGSNKIGDLRGVNAN